MTAPKQTTLNEHVNVEAIRAYIERLDANTNRIDEYGWVTGHTQKQTDAMFALIKAARAMRAALELAAEAERLASEVHYDRIYRRVS